MSVELDRLEIKIQSNADQAAANIDKLTAALKRLRTTAKGGAGLTTVKKQLDQINTARFGSSAGTEKVTQAAKPASGLESVKKASGTNTASAALQQVSEAVEQMGTGDFEDRIVQMENMAKAVAALLSSVEKFSAGASKVPVGLEGVKKAVVNAALAFTLSKNPALALGSALGSLGSSVK